jgi:MFS family permease
MAAVQNTTLAIATNVTPQNIRGTGFGTLQLTSGIATLLANALGGLLWDQFSYKMTFLAGGILAAGALKPNERSVHTMGIPSTILDAFNGSPR